MVHFSAPLFQSLFNIAITERISQFLLDSHQNEIIREVVAFETGHHLTLIRIYRSTV
jgi:hypothetical protein